jgi:hypothetical protein
MNDEVNMAQKEKLTNNSDAPIADNQKAMTAGPGFCAQKWCDVFLTILQISHCHQNDSISQLKLIGWMGTETLYSWKHGA